MKTRIHLVTVNDGDMPRIYLFADETEALDWLLLNVVLPRVEARERSRVERAFTVDPLEIISEYSADPDLYVLTCEDVDVPVMKMLLEEIQEHFAGALQQAARLISRLFTSIAPSKGN